MRLYKMFYGDSTSGPLDMVMLRRAINEIAPSGGVNGFSIAVFDWARPIGHGIYYRDVPVYEKCIAPLLMATQPNDEIGAAVGLGAEINKRSLEIVQTIHA